MRCPGCRYDLRSHDADVARCPECGRTVTRADSDPRVDPGNSTSLQYVAAASALAVIGTFIALTTVGSLLSGADKRWSIAVIAAPVLLQWAHALHRAPRLLLPSMLSSAIPVFVLAGIAGILFGSYALLTTMPLPGCFILPASIALLMSAPLCGRFIVRRCVAYDLSGER